MADIPDDSFGYVDPKFCSCSALRTSWSSYIVGMAQANFMEGNEIPRYCHIIQWKAQRDEKPSEYLGNFLNYLDDILQKFLEKNYEVGINAVREAKTLFIKHNLTSCVQCEKPFCLKN